MTRPEVRLPSGATEPVGLVDAVLGYEAALMADDIAALDGFFAPGPDTLRGDPTGLLVGHDAIAAFRRGRGGVPKRRMVRLELRPIPVTAVDAEDALVVAVVEPASGGRGQQTQLWHREAGRWLVRAAHVSQPPAAMDARIWRVLGAPLLSPTGVGPLDGRSVAVKDLFDVTGFAVGAGNPSWLAAAVAAGRVAASDAPALAALRAAGASVRGVAQTDEFAYSIAGDNPHYGTPPNALVPGAMPGGSSSGPASAVAHGHADLGLATDTAGSIRVPASYQGLWGLRTTHGAVSRDGLLPLAPSFDTVGWLAREPGVLRAAAEATLSGADVAESGAAGLDAAGFVVAPRLLHGVEPSALAAFQGAVTALAASGHGVAELDLGDPTELFECFRIVQAAEAWAANGAWLREHPGAVAGGAAARFAAAAAVTAEQEVAARKDLAVHRAALSAALGERVLLLPSASSAAPGTAASPAEIDAVRAATLRMCCVAGITGRPALSVPLLAADGPFAPGAPLGLCLVGPRGSDVALIGLGEDVAERLGRAPVQAKSP